MSLKDEITSIEASADREIHKIRLEVVSILKHFGLVHPDTAVVAPVSEAKPEVKPEAKPEAK